MSDKSIQLNGEARIVVSGTIDELLKELNLAGKRVAVERNRQIVPRDKYADTPLLSGDAIEVVHFVGGG